MHLKFHGAAGQVTGSMYQLTLDNGYNILIDCGLNYEKEFKREDNAIFPFEPSEIDLVILTHAHLDHSGNLPTLFSKGYSGKVICTEPTWTLCELLLTDSASLEAARVQRHHKKKIKTGGAKRLYGHGDVRTVVNTMVTLPFHETVQLNNALSITFIPAGHILGAASVVLEITEGLRTKKLLFTGDLGSTESLITLDPEIPEGIDYLIMESTYGARLHVDHGRSEQVLEKYIRETCIENRGRLVIPAFSVGRTQAILYALNKLFKSGKVPKVAVFADSPMGITSSEIHDKHAAYLNKDSNDFLLKYNDLFRFKELYVIEDQDDVEHMEHFTEPYIIVSSAGMLEGGRIQKHVKFNLVNNRCTILMAGYCIPGTLGHLLLTGQKQVRIQGKDYPVFANIAVTDAFSAHPDMLGLKKYHDAVSQKGNLTQTFLIHGDEESLLTFKNALNNSNHPVEIPSIGDSFIL